MRTRPQRPAGCVPTKGRLATIGGVALGATLALGGSADAATFTASNLDDTGSGSLRDALNQANATAEADTVNFASGLSGTIHLASSLQATPYPVAIQGPGASQITISGGGAVRDLILGCLCPQAPSFLVSGLTFTDGKATDGAGIISLLANLTISNSVISGNVAAEPGSGSAYGAGIYSINSSGYSRSLTIDHSTVADNSISSATGATNGAGIAGRYTKLTLTASAISGNTAVPSPPTNENFGGGVIVQFGSADISGSTIANNSSNSGGGIRIEGSTASSTIVNSTIAGNSAPYGGGIRWAGGNGPHTLTVTGSTISGNGKPGATAGFGGGIDDTDAPHVVLRDSIISGNFAHTSPDLYSAIPSYIPGSGFDAAFSLLGSTSGADVTDTVAGSNIVGQDPQLGALVSNGGPVQTMALPASSPAVDNGAAFGLTSDGRDVLRPIDFPDIPNSTGTGADGSDIGAFELQPSNAFTLGKLKKKKKKGTAVQTVNLPVPDAGTVTLSGKGLKPQTKSAMATGVLKLKVIAKGKTKKKLRRKGKAKVKEAVTYNPTGQTPNTLTKKLKLVKRPKRR